MSEVPLQAIQGDAAPAGNSAAFDPEDFAEGSRVCSTVASFDPERVCRSPPHLTPLTSHPIDRVCVYVCG